MEFIKGVGGFDFRKHSIAPAAALSSNGLYTFPLQIPAATPVGTYTVCYCHDQDDTKLQDVGDADTRFLLFDDVQVRAPTVCILAEYRCCFGTSPETKVCGERE